MAVMLGLIAISFAIWGIGDIFRGFGQSVVAKVGGSEISIEQFRQYYNDRLQQLGRQFGRPLSTDQVRAIGLDRQILSQLIAERALDEQTRRMGLALSDAEIAKRIMSDSSFQGPTGQFDRFRFEQLIRQAGYTEPRFIAEQRLFAVRRQLADAIMAGVDTPKTAVTLVSQFQNEQRSIEYVTLDRAQAGDIPEPTPEVLNTYFEQNKAQFRAPEYRRVTVLELTPTEMAKWVDVSDADARAAYDAHKDQYVTPERRQIQQIVFPNAEEAKAAADKIAAGTDFKALAAERGLKDTDIDLGSVTKASMVDRAIADAAFALKEGEVSAPVQGRFGLALLRVVKIEPEQVRPFEAVAAEIKRNLALERVRAEISDTHDRIEDERAAGSTLAEVAQKHSLQARTIEAVDRLGRGPDGNPVSTLPTAVDILPGVFSTDVGVETDPLQVDNGFVWYEVTGITPARDRSLDEVKDQLVERWRNQEIAGRLRAKATEMIDKMKAGTSFADVAAASNLKVDTATNLRRNQPPEALSARVLDDVFRTPKGETGSVEAERPGERIVFRVTDVVEPKMDPNSPEAKRISDALTRALKDDVLGEYIVQLQKDLGTTINEQAFQQVVGGGSQN